MSSALGLWRMRFFHASVVSFRVRRFIRRLVSTATPKKRTTKDPTDPPMIAGIVGNALASACPAPSVGDMVRETTVKPVHVARPSRQVCSVHPMQSSDTYVAEETMQLGHEAFWHIRNLAKHETQLGE